MNYRNYFENWFKKFQETDIFKTMEATVENSPYHREDNVGVHTKMVVDFFMEMNNDHPWGKNDFLGALTCAFHDVGKPASEETHEREDGSTYRSYKSHEQISGSMFMDYVLTDKGSELAEHLTHVDMYNVWVMVVHHQPYKYNMERLRMLKNHMEYFGLVDTFLSVCRSDGCGRIVDNSENLIKNLDDFDERFHKAQFIRKPSNDSKTVCILVGAQGVGKSTIVNQIKTENEMDGLTVDVHSMDTLRKELYSEDHVKAFFMSNEDKDFGNKVTADFNEKLKNSDYLIIDNTNISFKRRVRYRSVKNAKIVSYVLWRGFDETLERNFNRKESVKEDAVSRVYYSAYPVLYGEVDEIVSVFNGMETRIV